MAPHPESSQDHKISWWKFEIIEEIFLDFQYWRAPVERVEDWEIPQNFTDYFSENFLTNFFLSWQNVNRLYLRRNFLTTFLRHDWMFYKLIHVEIFLTNFLCHGRNFFKFTVWKISSQISLIWQSVLQNHPWGNLLANFLSSQNVLQINSCGNFPHKFSEYCTN